MNEELDFSDKMCPFLVMYILQEVAKIHKGDSKAFLVQDPLALKSIPEELAEISDLEVRIDKADKTHWRITIARSS